MAYALLGSVYFGQGQPELAGENEQKAFLLRDRASERERFYIESHYYHFSTRQLEKTAQVYEQWRQIYPRDWYPSCGLGIIHSVYGDYENAVNDFRASLEKDPTISINYLNLAQALFNLGRIEDAGAVLDEMQKRKLDTQDATRYLLAFLRGDTPEMERQVSAAAGNLGAATFVFFAQSDTEAYHGRLAKAREFTQEAVAAAIRSDAKETAAVWQADAALREAEFGNFTQAVQQAAGALTISNSKDVRVLAALAFARGGRVAQAQTMAAELKERFPNDTLLNAYWLPTIVAAIELEQHNDARALDDLQAASPYELAQPSPFPPAQLGPMYPVYLRGAAFLLGRRGSEAASEFHKIVSHPGVVVNYPLGALAHLGLARAYVLQHDQAKARIAYQEFLSLWKEADPAIPVLRQAKTEYAALQ